jgi:hypothetical protein
MSTVSTVDALTRELRTQAAFVKDREPVYERLLTLIEDAIRGEFGAQLTTLWAARTFTSPYERPLLLLAALRYDALCEGEDHPLSGALSGVPVRVDAVTPDALAAALSPTRTRLRRALRDRAVQTNETTRAVAWLWPAHLLSSAGERRSIALVDLGTSAGLNLVADDLPGLWVDEREVPIPIEPRPPIALRLGLDVAPLDVRRRDDAMWLRACVWPSDQPRLERLERAIEAFAAVGTRPDAPVLEVCALADAPARLSSLPDSLFVLCVQTIVRDYLTPAERDKYDAGMKEFLLGRPPHSALLAELEVDLGNLASPGRSATLLLRFATKEGNLGELLTARTHPHPRQLFTDADAVGAFRAAFRPVGM